MSNEASSAPLGKVEARQQARAEERSAAIKERLTQLVLAVPEATHSDLKYIAIWCGSEPSFSTILRVIRASRNSRPASCPHCDGPMDDAGLFEGMCSPCGREYADADPSLLGPDA